MRKTSWALNVLIPFVALVFFAVNAVGAPVEEKPVPVAFFPEKRFQFKPVLQGAKVTHVYLVQNKGKAELLIKKIKPG